MATSRVLTTEEIAMIETFNSLEVSSDVITNQALNLEFQGFSPVVMWRALNNIMAASDQDGAHLSILITFGLTRGFGARKNWEAIYSRTNEAGTNLLRAARAVYSVQLGRQRNSTVVTIPRLLQCFPHKTYQHYCILKRAERIRSLGYVGNLPSRLQWIGSPAMMNDACWNRYRAEYIEFSMFCSGVWRNPQDSDTAASFADLNHNTTLVPPTLRLSPADAAVPL